MKKKKPRAKIGLFSLGFWFENEKAASEKARLFRLGFWLEKEKADRNALFRSAFSFKKGSKKSTAEPDPAPMKDIQFVFIEREIGDSKSKFEYQLW